MHQAARFDADGKKRYLDVVIEAPSSAQIGCEIDGAIHLAEIHYWNDMSRSNELLIAGQPLLRFPSIAMRLDEERVMNQVRRALAARTAEIDISRVRSHWQRAS